MLYKSRFIFIHAYELRTLRLSTHINTKHSFWIPFASLSSGWGTTTGRLFDPKGISGKQRSIASPEIDPEASNLSITN